MPEISVIVPVYRVEPYLRRCVDSILSQTFTDFELILVDDGSPDNCGTICDEYALKDSRVRVIHKQNGGLSDARNAGIDIAKGEFLSFIDSDDLVAPEYLNKLYCSIKSSAAEISICNMLPFKDGSNPQIEEQNSNDSKRIISGRDACLSIYRMDGTVPIMAWGKLYKSSLFRGIRYPVGLIHEDDATTPKLLYQANRVAQIGDKLYLYRSRADSIMSQPFSAKRFDCLSAVDSCIMFFKHNQDDELVQLAKRTQLVMQSKTVLMAYSNDAIEQIPACYRMHEWKALRNIYKWTSNNTYSWYLSLVHPKLVRPHSYWVKIRQILGMDNKS